MLPTSTTIHKSLLLLQPPVVKPSEPPLALAVLQASLAANGVPVASLDASLEAFLYLLDGERLQRLAGDQPETAISRALRHRQASLHLLRSAAATRSFSRYCTAVRYLNKLLSLWTPQGGAERLTLGDYQHQDYSAFSPEDLQAFAGGECATLFRSYYEESLLPQVECLRPDVIAISINYLHQALPAFELAGLLRLHFPAAILVAGGGLISSWREPLEKQELRLFPFDHLVFGPGEASLAGLATGRRCAYRLADDREVAFDPDFSFARLGDYLSPRPLLPLSASRGCYWRKCLFCPEAAAPVQSYRNAGPDRFVELLLDLATQYGVRDFHLTDNAIPLAVLKGMAVRREELRSLNWFGFVRFEKQLEDEEFVHQLARGGCRMLQLGLESGSQLVLDRLGKGITLESVEKILYNLQAAGIASYVYLMLGTPGETRADAELTRDFLLKHADRIGFLNLSIMNLPRSSGLLDDPAQFGISALNALDADSPLGLYQEFETVADWDRAAVRRFLDQQLLGSDVIRTIVKRTPPYFTSNHAGFFTALT